MARDLRPVYTAVNETDAARCLDEFHTIWDNRYPAIKTLWTNAWPEFVPFLDYSPEIRRVIYTTDEIVKREWSGVAAASATTGHEPRRFVMPTEVRKASSSGGSQRDHGRVVFLLVGDRHEQRSVAVGEGRR